MITLREFNVEAVGTGWFGQVCLDVSDAGAHQILVKLTGMPVQGSDSYDRSCDIDNAADRLPEGWTGEFNTSRYTHNTWEFRRTLIGPSTIAVVNSLSSDTVVRALLEACFHDAQPTPLERVTAFSMELSDLIADTEDGLIRQALMMARDRVSYLVREDRLSTILEYLPDLEHASEFVGHD